MNNKTIILLGTILLGLVAIAAAPKIFKQDPTKAKELKNVSVDLSSFSKENVSKIVFGKGEELKTLSLFGNEWQINNQKADQTKVEFFFSDLQDAKVLKLASTNDANHAKFGVTPEDGTTLKISSDKNEEEFYVGKSGPSYGTFYIRKKGIKNVYLMGAGFNTNLTWVESEWKEQQPEESENSATPELDDEAPLQ